MNPTDGFTHSIAMIYHGNEEHVREGEEPLQPAQITRAEVEEELRLDEWNDLVTGNGIYVPKKQQGRSRLPEEVAQGAECNRRYGTTNNAIGREATFPILPRRPGPDAPVPSERQGIGAPGAGHNLGR